MAPWLPAVQAVLPYLAQVVTAAIPAFTQKGDKSETDDLTRRQISELQLAVVQNAESIKTVATQMQQVIQDLDAASARIEAGMRTTRQLALAALLVALAALGLSLYTWMH
jgi:methyl coenzyme M reductase beta subunit